MTTLAQLLRCICIIAVFSLALAACKDDPTGTDAPPGQPTNLVAVPIELPNAAAAALTWHAPADSAVITGYRVWWQIAPAGARDSADVDASKRSYSITGLKVGQSYIFSVAARKGDRLSSVTTTPWGGVFTPAAPTAPQITFASATVAHLVWTAAADTGITGYRISWRLNLQADSSAIDVPAATASADIPDLDRAKAYTFQVQSKRGGLLSPVARIQWAGESTTPPSRPAGLVVAPLTNTSVRLSWTPSADTGAITYGVKWIGKSVADSGSLETAASEAVVTGLIAGKIYTFSVAARRGGAASNPIALDGAPASRFVNDVSGGTLKMYETASPSYGPAMIVDPALGGPKRVKTNSSPLGNIQLAVYTKGTDPNFFSIGPAYAFVEYINADQFDKTVFVSDSTYPVVSLDTWISAGSIESHIPSNGNVRAFDLPVSWSQTMGMGFFIRTGNLGDYHYARVFVKNVDGKFLQGDAPNRYVELEISYQTAANVPYAKTPARGVSAGIIASRPRR